MPSHTHARALVLIGTAQALGVGTSLLLAGVGGDRFTLALARFAFGVVAFCWAFRTVRTLDRTAWIGATIYAVDILLFLVAISLAPLAVVVAIITIAPLLAVLLERLRGCVRLTRWGLLSVLLGTCGAGVSAAVNVTGPVSGTAVVGVLLAVAAALGTAASTVLLQESSRHSPWAMTQAINIMGALLTVPVILFVGWDLSAGVLWVGAVAAVAGGGLAVVANLAALRLMPASVVMALGSVGLPLTAALGVVFLDQPVGPASGVGYVAVAATVVIAATKPLSTVRPGAGRQRAGASRDE